MEIMLPLFWELSFLRSRVKLGPSSDSAADTSHTHVQGQIEPSEVFSADAINSIECCGRQNTSALVIVIPK